MQDTSGGAGTETLILRWAAIATAALTLSRPIGRFLSWLIHQTFLSPLEKRMDDLSKGHEKINERLDNLTDDVHAIARAIQRIELRCKGCHHSEEQETSESIPSASESSAFPVQILEKAA